MSPASAARISGTPAATSRSHAPARIAGASAPSSEARTIQRLMSSAVGIGIVIGRRGAPTLTRRPTEPPVRAIR
jgi:hypothetical protein